LPEPIVDSNIEPSQLSGFMISDPGSELPDLQVNSASNSVADQTPLPEMPVAGANNSDPADRTNSYLQGSLENPDSATESIEHSTILESADPPASNPDIDLFAKPAEDASFLNLPAAFIRASVEHSSPSLIKPEPPHTPNLPPDLKQVSAPQDERLLDRLENALADLEEESETCLEEPVPPGISLERQPARSRLLRPVVYGIEVPNTGTKPLFQVRVEHELPAGFRYLGSDPPPEIRGSKLVWKLGDLEPKSVSRILVRVQPKNAGKLLPESATTFRTAYGVRTRITKPKLQILVVGPERARRGDPVDFEIQVSNSGTDQAKNVQVRNLLSSGLSHEQGPKVEVTLGSLMPGECIKLSLRTTARESGSQRNEVTVTGTDCISSTSEASVLVTQPAIQFRFSGPAQLPLNRETEYHLVTYNSGTANAESLEGRYDIPEGLEIVGGEGLSFYDPVTRTVSWSIPRLDAGQSHSLPVHVLARFPGDFQHRATLRTGTEFQEPVELITSTDFDSSQKSRLLEDLVAGLDDNARHARAPRIDESSASDSADSSTRKDQYLVFTLAGLDYAVSTASLLEVSRLSSITSVPNVPPWVLGVANVRGDIVSMVDLGAFLGLTQTFASVPDGRVLVVRTISQEIMAGLLVEKVKGLRLISGDRITVPAASFENRLSPFMRGVSDIDGRLLVFLDLDRLLLSAEMLQVEPV
jgi:purine-binding chemotaxis protein CheW